MPGRTARPARPLTQAHAAMPPRERPQVFRLKAEPTRDQWQGRKLTLRINSTADLWNVLNKSQYGT